MSKRKYGIYSDSGTDDSKQKKPVLQQSRVQGILDNGKTLLFRALKVARGFERQKLGRRQKIAKADKAESEVTRLDEEIVALKNLDLPQTAGVHLYKTLLKIKSVASALALPNHIQAWMVAARRPQGIALANVQARLFNSAPVKMAMMEITNQVGAALGVPEASTGGKKRLRAKDYANGDNTSADKHSDMTTPNPATGDDVHESFDLTNTREGSIEDDADVQINELDAYASRFAVSDDDPTGVEDGQRRNDFEWSDTRSASYASFASPLDEKQVSDLHNTSAPRPKSGASAAPSSTTFLPTLSLGGYWSGSESGMEENFQDDAGAVPTRKNRRGQRARQKIAEKKYKDKANHLKKQAQSRDAGWDGRRGARTHERGDERRRKGGFAERSGGDRARGSRGPMSSGANSDPVKLRSKAASDGPLHPSWQAAKKAKEQKTSQVFQGKKLVLD